MKKIVFSCQRSTVEGLLFTKEVQIAIKKNLVGFEDFAEKNLVGFEDFAGKNLVGFEDFAIFAKRNK